MALVGLYPILTMPKRASDSSHQKKKKKKKKRAKTDKPGPSSASSGRASAKMTGASIKMTSGADTGIVLATFPGGPPAPGTLLGASSLWRIPLHSPKELRKSCILDCATS